MTRIVTVTETGTRPTETVVGSSESQTTREVRDRTNAISGKVGFEPPTDSGARGTFFMIFGQIKWHQKYRCKLFLFVKVCYTSLADAIQK